MGYVSPYTNKPLNPQCERCEYCNPREESTAVVCGKALLVALVVAGLAVATFFSVTGVFALVVAGAATWKIGLVGVTAVISIVAFLGSIYYSGKHNMFEDTGHNKRDIKNYLKDSLT